MEKIERVEIELEGKTVKFETGKMALQADGAVLVQLGDTMVLVTAVASDEATAGDFLPLTVDVEEKMYAAGKIPGGFIKREGRPSERSTLTARLIDRPLRPSFPKGFRNQMQVIATILSVDQINPPDILALNGASAALVLSDIPSFQGPIGAVRVAYVNERWITNPTYQELDDSQLDLVVAGNKEAILMVEAGAEEIEEEMFVEGIEKAHLAIGKLIEAQESLREKAGKAKREVELFEVEEKLAQEVIKQAEKKLNEIVVLEDKESRKQARKALIEEVKEKLEEEFEEEQLEQHIKEVIKEKEKELVRARVLQDNKRLDGRKSDEIREISCEVGILPRTHGSGLFKRGETQVLTVLTLGTVSEGQTIDGIGLEESKRFMHHYNFPPFSRGEVAFMRGPKRRDIGHGALAERALSYVLPEETQFPYTVRLVSEVLGSNGSTSMASTCASALALMDAGVPIRSLVGGIAMGLVKEGDKEAILTDISGEEDAIGDMDFKVAGTHKGITALQMDIKLKDGLPKETLQKALKQAKQAREFILDKMEAVIKEPRKELSEFAPRIITLKINPDKIREVIGPGGKTIRSITEETGVTIDIEDDGTVFIASKDEEGGKRAQEIVEMITKEVKAGEKYLGKVTRITNFGAFVEILPGRDGLVHISKLAKGRVDKVEDVVKVGDKIQVEVIEIDKLGRINLSKADLQ